MSSTDWASLTSYKLNFADISLVIYANVRYMCNRKVIPCERGFSQDLAIFQFSSNY